jgi:hypothetical protein
MQSPLPIFIGIVLLGVLAVEPARAEKGDGKKADFKMQGRLGLGAETNADDRVEDVFETRLGIRTKRKKGTRVNVELRADEGSREVLINDAFADYRDKSKTHRVRGGRGKKIMGWEYEYPTADRLSIHRSLAYSYLADRALVGRDYFVSYHWFDRADEPAESSEKDSETEEVEAKTRESDLDSSVANPTFMIDPDQKWKLGASVHYDESKNAAYILDAIATLGDKWRVGAWLSMQWTRSQHRRLDTLEGVLSALFQSGKHRATAEVFAGGDPSRTLIAKFYGSGRTVSFAAAKLDYGAYFGEWNPYIVLTRLWRDLAHRGDYSDERILGIRRYLGEDFSVAAELRSAVSRSDYDLTTVPYQHETVGFIARYFF